MKSFRFIALLTLLSLLVSGAIWFTDIPLGIPGEWVWDRIGPPLDWGLTLIMAGVCGAIYFTYVWAGEARIVKCRSFETGLWLCGMVLLGFGWLWVAQDAAPADRRFSKTAWVLYYPGASGYFTMARDHEQDFDEFLSGYETLMAEGDVLHVGTHPPGLFIAYHWLIETCRSSPNLTAWLRFTEPASFSDAMDLIAQKYASTPQAMRPEHRAAIWLAALLTQFTAAATVIPLFLLILRDFTKQTAWLAVSLWPTVPALALFLPKSDALYPLLGVLIWYFWLTGWEQRSAWRSLLAGGILLIGLTCSLAIIPVWVGLGIITLWRGWLCNPEQRVPGAMAKLWFSKTWAAIGFLLPGVALWWVTGINLLTVWIWNYRNHAGFYAEYPRTYWKWLAVNPLEFCIAAGIPLACCAILGGLRMLRSDSRSRLAGLVWTCLCVGGLLWISGKNMGELARLWILLMPWLVWLAAGSLAVDSEPSSLPIRSRWAAVFVLQLAVGIAMLMRVHGFQMP
ncbi:hypothetical protein [Symmachiella dynata]|uniref:hypothetical protein n=1 Tax=Symmachiella dynata TaxID=2527995 RepID=UPI0030EC913A